MSKPIKAFRGTYGFLSNFWRVQVEFEGRLYPTVEHAYQAAKTLDHEKRSRIAMAPTPGYAKSLGRKVVMRDDWDEVKVAVMEQLLRSKFKYRVMSQKLKATGDRELIEVNSWGDTFWGVCRGKGENNLGKLLMKIRSEL